MKQPIVDLDFRLDDKVALVTGGASGIGAAISSAFAAKGARVAVVDLNEAGASQAARALPTDSIGFACDVSDPDSVSAAVDAVAEAFDRIDILVNSAGIVMLAPAEELSLKAWDATIDVNLKGTFLMCQAVGTRMLAAGAGAIINMASQAASVALDQHVAYCASKFGVVGVSKVLAAEWAGRGVRVNTISPTVVLTELGHKAWDGPRGDEMKKLIPTGRFAYPDEIAAAAVFLASEAAAMINGADLLIDGGYTIR
jgi:NAD(P)-dependent dehydrogenase (short-subunit alcohol dehydrogenase family)